MEQGFNGLIPSIKNGQQLVYNPSDFDLDSLRELFTGTKQKREYQISGNPYMLALLNGNEELIEYYARRDRVQKITNFRNLINKYGNENARVIAILNKSRRAYYQDTWHFYSFGEWRYKDICDGELDTISLTVKLENNRFTISLLADDMDGYGGYKYRKVLSSNVSFKSVLNQIKYFTTKLKNGYYAGSK